MDPSSKEGRAAKSKAELLEQYEKHFYNPPTRKFKYPAMSFFFSGTNRHRETPTFFAARWRNVAVGGTLLVFVGAVFAYTMRSVSNDDFKAYDRHGIKKE